jgi:Rieske Fe-S protein
MTSNSHKLAEANSRRDVFKQAIALFCGALALLIPGVAGMAALLDPLRRKGNSGGGFLRLASMEALPEDGTPRKFPVIAERTDAWTRFPAEPVGAVFLRRVGKQVVALQATCPHAGCSIDFQGMEPTNGKFFCPCHGADFDLFGKRLQPRSVSPRDMDSLEVEIRSRNEVWVKFQTFQSGATKKIAQG